MGETDSDGNKDENVFDIRQGIAIVFLIIKAEVIAMGERQAVVTVQGVEIELLPSNHSIAGSKDGACLPQLAASQASVR